MLGETDYDPTMCKWVNGVPRVRVGWDQVVRAYLVLHDLCYRLEVVGTAVSQEDPTDASLPGNQPTVPSGQRDENSWASWIEFSRFGHAGQPDRLPQERTPIDPAFKIEFGDVIRAERFQLRITDDRVVKTFHNLGRIVSPEIAGQLTGRFDFEVERGRGAQTFP